MATERSLATLIRSLQTASAPEDAYTLLPTSTTFLSVLTNPLNVTLLASQLLTSPAIWEHPVDLHACRRILSVFNTAAITIIQNETANEPRPPYASQKGLDREAWVKAVVNGADEKSPRWRHVLLLGGVLLGFEGQKRQGLRVQMRRKVESALVTAAQLALQEVEQENDIAGYCITMVLNYTFELLSDGERNRLDYDRLLPLMVNATFFSNEGLERAYFLGIIDRDVVEVPNKMFCWSAQSMTYRQMKGIMTKPLISSLGPLSRLIAHAIENVRDANLVADMVSSISDFSRTMLIQWRQNKLSEVDASEETEFLDPESLKTTIPDLWQLLRSCMFSMVIILRAVMGRVVNDPVLAADKVSPFVSMQTLHTLRNLYFVSFRVGQNASSQYAFVNLVAIDILCQYSELAENFLRTIRPSDPGQIPANPLERCLDLFFLNTAEHFTLALPPQVNEELIISAAMPYLPAGGNNHLLEIFEAAHSVVLAVFAAPQNAEVAVRHLPFYVDTLFSVFPQNLSARQFRLAFKSVVQISTPPSPLANQQPLLASILLELAHDRALHASSTILPPPSLSADQAALTETNAATDPLSEKTTLILSIIDSLCFLRVPDLEEWLPLTARLIHTVQDENQRRTCVERFWDSLSSGEMDVERAYFCVTWWSTRGGRELVLFGEEPRNQQERQNGEGRDEEQQALMSGGLGSDAANNRGESKL